MALGLHKGEVERALEHGLLHVLTVSGRVLPSSFRVFFMSSEENTFLGKFVMRENGTLGPSWVSKMCCRTSTSMSDGLKVWVRAPPPSSRIWREAEPTPQEEGRGGKGMSEQMAEPWIHSN